MRLTAEDIAGVIVLTPHEDKLDATLSYLFKETALRNLRDDRKRYLLDLSQVRFIDSSGVGAVVAILKGLNAGEKLWICGMSPAVDRVFRLLHLDRIFQIYETREDALDDNDAMEQSSGPWGSGRALRSIEAGYD